jgi:hypothetical protein
MKKQSNRTILFIISLIAVSLLICGCGGTGQSTVKANSFGKTQKDAAVLEAAIAKFGELGKGGTPRILNPILTTGVQDYLPIDQVQAYNKDVKMFQLWFVYDNFNDGDTGVITWKYLETGETVAIDNITFTSTSDAKFGRYNANVVAPVGGWPIGKYFAMIQAKGAADATAYFEVVDGPTVTVNFDLGGNTQTPIVGNDKDEHGCIGSAGYTWCEIKNKCLKTWEEKCEVETPIVGNDKDEHGCIGSAGYTWCEIKQKCLRAWEEKCEAAEEQIVGNDKDEHGCIGSAGYTWCEAKQKCLRSWEEKCEAQTPTVDAAAEAQKCYEDNYYKKQIDDAYAANIAATTWNSYWANIGADADCNVAFNACNTARSNARYYDSLTVSGYGGDGLRKLEVDMIRLCYNREVACNELAFKKKCNIANPNLKTFAKIDEQECNDAYNEVLKTFRDWNIEQNVNNQLPIAKHLDCYDAYQKCGTQASDVNHACQAAITNSDYTVCTNGYNKNMVVCETNNINCHASYYAQNCKTIAQI